MRNMAVLHSPAFSYPLPVLVRVLFNLLIFKGKILYYNKYTEIPSCQKRNASLTTTIKEKLKKHIFLMRSIQWKVLDSLAFLIASLHYIIRIDNFFYTFATYND